MLRFGPVAAVVMRYVFLLRGSPVRILPLFTWALLDVILWGFITRYLDQIANAGFSFVPALLGAVLLWDFLTRVMHGVSLTFFEDVWSRNFLNLFASPMRVGEYIAGLILTGLGSSLIGLLVMLVMAWAVFGLSLAIYGAAAVPFVLVLILFGMALGLMAAALVLRLGPAAEWFVWPIPGMLSPFAGVFYPVSVLPEWMQWVSRLLPPAYVFEGLRAIAAGKGVSWATLGAAGVLALGYVVLGAWIFSRVHRHAVRTGLIARYSAESAA
jgi:ABC-2 type transport system permease protein